MKAAICARLATGCKVYCGIHEIPAERRDFVRNRRLKNLLGWNPWRFDDSKSGFARTLAECSGAKAGTGRRNAGQYDSSVDDGASDRRITFTVKARIR